MSFWTSRLWRRALDASSLIAAIVALGAAVLVYRASERALHEQYLGLAITILNESKTKQTDIDLRAWALLVFQSYSPFPLPAKVAADLKAGATTLTSAVGTLDDAARAELDSAIKDACGRERALRP